MGVYRCNAMERNWKTIVPQDRMASPKALLTSSLIVPDGTQVLPDVVVTQRESLVADRTPSRRVGLLESECRAALFTRNSSRNSSVVMVTGILGIAIDTVGP